MLNDAEQLAKLPILNVTIAPLEGVAISEPIVAMKADVWSAGYGFLMFDMIITTIWTKVGWVIALEMTKLFPKIEKVGFVLVTELIVIEVQELSKILEFENSEGNWIVIWAPIGTASESHVVCAKLLSIFLARVKVYVDDSRIM